jgi:hypothetical protein
LKVLFFSPHAAVWRHAFPEALVAEALSQHGHEIVYVSCGGLLRSHCIPMSAYLVGFGASDAEKQRICSTCAGNERIVRDEFGFAGETLAALVDAEDLAFADGVVAGVDLANCLDLVVDGIEVGRLAMYELLLDAKKSSLDFTPGEWAQYRSDLRNVLVVQRVVQRLLDSIRPDRIVLYNALYSINRTVSRIAEQRGIPQYFLHAGGNLARRLSTLIVARGHTLSFYDHMREKWHDLCDRPRGQRALSAVTDHFLEVTRGRSEYAYSRSPDGDGMDLRKRFGIEPERKILCAMMSSYDERFAAETVGALRSDHELLFRTQVDWIRALAAHVAGRDDVALIVRIHPREFSKRAGRLSEHAQMLQKALTDLPPNVIVNWPADNISLYDIANVTDAVASAWSSSGKEMALLGIPVVLYSPELIAYPADLNYTGTKRDEYFALIDKALAEGWSSDWIRAVYRWCALEYSDCLIDISSSYGPPEGRAVPVVARAINRALRRLSPQREQTRDCRNRVPSLPAASVIEAVIAGGLSSPLDLADTAAPPEADYDAETRFLKEEVRRLVSGMYGRPASLQQNSVVSRLWRFATA